MEEEEGYDGPQTEYYAGEGDGGDADGDEEEGYVQESYSAADGPMEPQETGGADEKEEEEPEEERADAEAEADTFFAVARFDFVGEDDAQLSFHAGDAILVLEQTDEQWWYGELGGVRGSFPAEYTDYGEGDYAADAGADADADGDGAADAEGEGEGEEEDAPPPLLPFSDEDRRALQLGGDAAPAAAAPTGSAAAGSRGGPSKKQEAFAELQRMRDEVAALQAEREALLREVQAEEERVAAQRLEMRELLAGRTTLAMLVADLEKVQIELANERAQISELQTLRNTLADSLKALQNQIRVDVKKGSPLDAVRDVLVDAISRMANKLSDDLTSRAVYDKQVMALIALLTSLRSRCSEIVSK